MAPTPDKEEPDKSPPRRDPADLSPGERDLWADDDLGELEDLDIDALGDLEDLKPGAGAPPAEDKTLAETEQAGDEETTPADPVAEAAEEVEADLEEEPDAEEQGDAPAQDSEVDAEDAAPEEDLIAEPAEDEEDPSLAVEDIEIPEGDSEEEPPAIPAAEAEEEPGRFSGTDLIWLGVLGAFLLGVVIFGIALFNKNVNTEDPGAAVDFPIKGESVVVSDIETYWRKPDRDKDTGVRLDAKLIPAADVRIKASSGTGALRFFFEDPSGRTTGDAVTLGITGGKFDVSGTPEAEIYCTGGMAAEGEYAAYITEELEFWHLVVLEGPSATAEGREFVEILKMRISNKRR